MTLRSSSMPAEHLLYAVALAMLVYAGVVEGGCCNVVRLLGPLETGDRVRRCAGDRVEVDGWQRALRAWRHATSSGADQEEGMRQL